MIEEQLGGRLQKAVHHFSIAYYWVGIFIELLLCQVHENEQGRETEIFCICHKCFLRKCLHLFTATSSILSKTMYLYFKSTQLHKDTNVILSAL